MTAPKVNVSIQGYGDVAVKIPKRWRKSKRDRADFADGVASAVGATLQVMDPPATRFHMALGRIQK